MTKTCTKCLQDKSYEDFHKCSKVKSGVRAVCKDCRKSYRDVHKAEKSAYDKMRTAENSVEKAAYDKIYNEQNKMRISAKFRAWRIGHPDSIRINGHRRRALLAANKIEHVPSNIWEQLVDFYGAKCMHPGCTNTKLSLDHIVPIAKGGAHAIDNFQILCRSHNSSKGAHHSTDYRPYPRMPLTLPGIACYTVG